jgi:hypothetical protein
VSLIGGENLFKIDRARQELAFCPRVNLAEGVRLSVQWFREESARSVTPEGVSPRPREQRA